MVRVLIVDDNPDERKIFATTLYHNGYEPVEAATGMDAISAAKLQCPDLILMDVKLPDMHGFLAAEIIRSIPGLEGVPVICTTGMDMSVDEARRRGFADFLQKPFPPQDLIAAVRRNLLKPPAP